MRPTSWRVLLAVAVLGGVSGWALVSVWKSWSGAPPGVPWTAPLTLGVLAAGFAVAAVTLRPRLRREEGHRPVDPFVAARAAVLAMAGSRAGAFVAGGYLGYAVFLLLDLSNAYRRSLLVPVAVERASYGPAIFLAGVAASFALAFVLVRKLYHGRLRRSAPWDCGFPWQTPRMQDTAEGFGQPIRQIFEPLFRMTRQLPTPFDAEPHYRVTIGDHFWYWLYLPVARVIERMAKLIGLLQQGRIAAYLLYSFLTLIAVLVWVTR